MKVEKWYSLEKLVITNQLVKDLATALIPAFSQKGIRNSDYINVIPFDLTPKKVKILWELSKHGLGVIEL
jgi:hypothetical protein